MRLTLLASVMTLGLIVGCGGLTSSSEARVTLKGTGLQSVNLIVVPNGLAASDETRCGDAYNQEWCTRDAGNDWKSRTFAIDGKRAPYAVYVENKTNTLKDLSFEVTIDGVPSADETVTVLPNQTVRIARIFTDQTQL